MAKRLNKKQRQSLHSALIDALEKHEPWLVSDELYSFGVPDHVIGNVSRLTERIIDVLIGLKRERDCGVLVRIAQLSDLYEQLDDELTLGLGLTLRNIEVVT